MRGRRIAVAWAETATELRALYRRERDGERARRLQALWLLREGRSIGTVAATLGVHYRTVQEWLSWYRAGGLAGVRARRSGGKGHPKRLTAAQEAELRARAAAGEIRTIGEAVGWVQERFGVTYRYFGMRSVFRRLGLCKKVPRPLGEKADPSQQEAWKKGAWRPA